MILLRILDRLEELLITVLIAAATLIIGIIERWLANR